MARCPGQDQRFWKPQDIFEVKCPVCKISVEFWKDEPQVKCPGCKHEIPNPRLDLGCAKWCQYAEECLGKIADSENTVLSNKLIECLRQIAGSDQGVIRDSLEILHYAEIIQAKEGGDPLVVKASAIFSCVSLKGKTESAGKDDIPCRDGSLSNVLAAHGVNTELIDYVFRILDACQSDNSMDAIEFNIIWDSCRLAKLHQIEALPDKASTDTYWKTETGRKLAQEFFRTRKP